MLHFAHDRRWLGGPDERLGIAVVDPYVLADRRDQRGDAGEGSATNALASDLRKPAFHEIQPRSAGRCEMQVVPRMVIEPLLDLRVRMGAVVVEDQMDLAPTRRRLFNALKELEEFAVPMPRQAASDHGAIEDVERGKQRG